MHFLFLCVMGVFLGKFGILAEVIPQKILGINTALDILNEIDILN